VCVTAVSAVYSFMRRKSKMGFLLSLILAFALPALGMRGENGMHKPQCSAAADMELNFAFFFFFFLLTRPSNKDVGENSSIKHRVYSRKNSLGS
jgi:hypothetical protein